MVFCWWISHFLSKDSAESSISKEKKNRFFSHFPLVVLTWKMATEKKISQSSIFLLLLKSVIYSQKFRKRQISKVKYITLFLSKNRATLYNTQEVKTRLYSKFLNSAPEKTGNYYVVDEAQIFCTSPSDLDVFFFLLSVCLM